MLLSEEDGLMAKVTVCTQCYNTKPYLEECVHSVLNQTFPDLEYVIIDSASTDGSRELLKEMAAKDERIRLILLEENQFGYWMSILPEIARSEYFSLLDSDDWWEPRFLEDLITFLEENQLDIATTGAFIERKNGRLLRKIKKPVIFSQQEFAKNYQRYYLYQTTVWGALLKKELLLQPEIAEVARGKYMMTEDTIMKTTYLMHCNRIGIHNSAMYHYRVHDKSISHRYNPDGFRGLTKRYETQKSFLIKNQALDGSMREFLKNLQILQLNGHYSKALALSDLTTDEKIADCRRILTHPQTQEILTVSKGNALLTTIWGILLQPGSTEAAAEDIKTIAQIIAPNCADAVTWENLTVFAQFPSLPKILAMDDREKLASELLNILPSQNGSEFIKLAAVLKKALPEYSPLSVVEDENFFAQHIDLARMIQTGGKITVLDFMTGCLLEGNAIRQKRDYLHVYLVLAALCNQESAFVFGKIQLAKFYYDSGEMDECKKVLHELDEIGAGGLEEVERMKKDCK